MIWVGRDTVTDWGELAMIGDTYDDVQICDATISLIQAIYELQVHSTAITKTFKSMRGSILVFIREGWAKF